MTFFTLIKVRQEKKSADNTYVVLNDIKVLESESAKIMYFDFKAIFLGIVPTMQF